MWTHGSAALGNLGNSFVGLVDDSNNGNKCLPDLISYSTIISGLCKAGRLDEAKKKFMEMMGKNLHPDSVIYDTFIHSFCKQGRISSAFRVLKDMEKKERVKDATSLLDEMLQKGISPNISTFRILIKAFCKGCDFGVAQELFDIALSVCGHKEALYSLMFNELLAGGEVAKATELFEEALDKYFYLGNFLYKDLIDRLCKDQKLEDACSILHNMMNKGYRFDSASFLPVIDGLGFLILGIEWQKIENPDLPMSMGMGLDQKGVRIRRMEPTSPESHILKSSDVLLSFDGLILLMMAQLSLVIATIEFAIVKYYP
ncbi:hypothetical protein J5N97_000538 [Dioscorea zingiberensis]|uniref:Pentatricopeptide repeat-containing protein n=1 Tax=Dioscorea zingiberensis TaxID=325984 RepID=A0A9D5BSD0_9LILI|nr:hypothetical protein J5N97_000538 [Dioscorea zingiberensis]